MHNRVLSEIECEEFLVWHLAKGVPFPSVDKRGIVNTAGQLVPLLAERPAGHRVKFGQCCCGNVDIERELTAQAVGVELQHLVDWGCSRLAGGGTGISVEGRPIEIQGRMLGELE